MKGIPANETRFTPKANRTRIIYEFVTDDGNTPSVCTIRIGDTDPISGERIDLEFFHDYYRQVDREIHTTLKTMRPGYTEDEKASRKEEARRFAAEFKREHGYLPSRDDLRYHLVQTEQKRYNLYYDSLTNPDGDSLTEYMPEFGQTDADPFGTDLPDDVYAIREFAKTLTGRRKDVYEAMLSNLSCGCRRITNTELARRWHVSESCIRKDQELIKKRIIRLFTK